MDEKATTYSPPGLPRVGEEVAGVVQVILKSNDDKERLDMKRFLHQAIVRRHVVVQLNAGAKRREHRAYVSVNMSTVRAKSLLLPENAVPPVIIRLLSREDDDLDKVLVQKAARPVGGGAIR